MHDHHRGGEACHVGNQRSDKVRLRERPDGLGLRMPKMVVAQGQRDKGPRNDDVTQAEHHASIHRGECDRLWPEDFHGQVEAGCYTDHL